MTKEIHLSRGYIVLVDDEDYEFLSSSKWHLSEKKYRKYAIRNLPCPRVKGTGYLRSMHRLILSAPKNLQVDHIDGNGLNNCRSNLRLCVNKENAMNSRKNTSGSSKYKGVSWHKDNEVWAAYIKINYKLIHLGYFKKEDDAATAYNMAALKNFREFARLNSIIFVAA